MGQSLKKFAEGGDGEGAGEESKTREIIADEFYDKYLKPGSEGTERFATFYHAVCEAAQKINNETLGGTQFALPSPETLRQSFNDRRSKKSVSLSKVEFREILVEVIKGTSVTGKRAVMKDIALYIFGVPISLVFLKRGFFPKLVPDDLLLPAATSGAVFFLAKANRI